MSPLSSIKETSTSNKKMTYLSSQREKPVIAAFDFDGTITYYDSLISFILFCFGPLRTLIGLLIKLPSIITYVLRLQSRQKTKEKLLTHFFKGMAIEELQDKGKQFADSGLKKIIRPEALKRISWHINQGHRCILISASIDTYLHPWATHIGFQDAITSKLEFNDDGIVTGKLVGLNCRGPEKVRRLKEMLGSKENYKLYAYGDSQGDKELLAFADYPYYRKMHD